jgi:hypothetical protein
MQELTCAYAALVSDFARTLRSALRADACAVPETGQRRRSGVDQSV